MPASAAQLMSFPIDDVHQAPSARDAILYALSVGYGTEPLNSATLAYHDDVQPRVAATFANVLAHPGHWLKAAGIDWSGVVHAEQRVEMHAPLQVAADYISSTKCTSVVDRGVGKGAFITFKREVSNRCTGQLVATVTQTDACRFDGGCGSMGTPMKPLARTPEIPPDITRSISLPQNAALLYRLNGDWNPLHADPAFAAQAGFERPLLHGLCTLGYAEYLIASAFAQGEMLRLAGFAARFTAPAFPGDLLTIDIWKFGDRLQFRGRVEARGATVLDCGQAHFHSQHMA